ncbi:MAG: glycoside hydrolase family 3 C-terminal domain-containing protein [Clostridia bacterium]|nr:glycoside hydrolase family 3 C-terminal domain-containing protein [Clostridia bacterium]
MEARRDAKELVAQMTLEEKASLCSGLNFWQLKGIKRLHLQPIMVTDGPHGLRKQAGAADHLGISQSVPATCFPTACATACSFDRELLAEIGGAMAEECLQEDVAVILGPGVNIKRSPLCGRNFEYFSEDPLLAGELAAALIAGVQEKGIGTSLKHYAANNQESRRMVIDVIADDRALREIYLRAFEIAVRKAQPWTVMCSYNRINGTYASDNRWLLTQVLREDWGFEGLVVTDWGAMNDRVEAVKAGLDLEMPGGGGGNDAKIVAAVQSGALKEEAVDGLAIRVADLILKAQAARQPGYRYDAEGHHALARKAAAQSCVLLKNEGGVLPLKPGAKAAIIGGFAKAPRYQGTGSSKIRPSRLDSPYEELAKLGFEVAYAEGYRGFEPDDALVAQAVEVAKSADVAIVYAGLPDAYESEGFDRTAMDIPASHAQLIRAVARANPNTVVVLLLGSPVVTDWAKDVQGLLVAYLGGQAAGGGVADVLSGAVCPGGKLAESWPLALADNPSYHHFPGGSKTVEYRESLFVGYRYYDAAAKAVAWPFGYGLSYTSFAYSDMAAEGYEVSFAVENTGPVEGAETAQVYVGLPGSTIIRPKKWLAGFEKVRLAPGERKTVRIGLTGEAFRYFNAAAGGWRVEGGTYTVFAGSSANDLPLTATVEVSGDGDEALLSAQSGLGYMNVTGNRFGEADFAALYGRPLPPSEPLPGEPRTVNTALGDVKDTVIGGLILAGARKQAEKALGGSAERDGAAAAMMEAALLEMPLRGLAIWGGGSLPPDFPELMVDALNGNPLSRAFATAKLMYRLARFRGKKKA